MPVLIEQSVFLSPFLPAATRVATAFAVCYRLQQSTTRHPELRSEAQTIAASVVGDVSVEETAEEVSDRVLGVGIDEQNGRAGRRSWGYVEPSEAAWELLEESIEDIVKDMKRRKEAGSELATEKICLGIVLGLYKTRDAQNDGTLGWAPDFPAEAAGQAVSDFIKLFPQDRRSTAGQGLLEKLKPHVGEWMEMLERLVQRSSS